ncbi:hypothetical protein [Candidatus Aquicultor secundus]|uniref:hypothetical protein n=1 Tax=Candidatus Aquicultor secundus TaxID=1973895 RepID=UPI00257DD482|nr:hypothetical protein [Candidatus Aquicultor secundus]NCO65325.1 hypothetical protein [Solirubrobacter sp.]
MDSAVKKRAILAVASLLLLILTSQAYAHLGSRYDSAKAVLEKVTPTKDPDNKEVKLVDVSYKANKDISNNKLKNVDKLPGYVSEADIAKKGGKYTLKSLMTYKEYFDMGIDPMLRHDIDPNRIVWVLISKFDKTHNVDGQPVEKATVTAAYDAETGAMISLVVTSSDPQGLKNLNKRPDLQN